MEKGITLESIAKEKNRLRQRINEVQQTMTTTTQSLMTEETPLTQRERIMNSISKGMAIVDGAVLGYRVFKRFRTFFKRKKKK